jgi:hypothetical protein
MRIHLNFRVGSTAGLVHAAASLITLAILISFPSRKNHDSWDDTAELAHRSVRPVLLAGGSAPFKFTAQQRAHNQTVT